MSGGWQALQGGLSSLGSGISDGLSNIGNFAGDLFGSGKQPMSGSPSAMGASLSDASSKSIPEISGGASPTLSASSFSSPTSALDNILNEGGGASPDALGKGAADFSAAGADKSTPTGGFNWGGLTRNIVPAASLINTIIRGNQVPPEIRALTQMAHMNAGAGGANAAGATQAMMGHLPGGAQASIDQALAAAQARIRSNYAALHMTGSTPEAQDLAYAQIAASAQAFQIGQGMAQTGFSAAAGENSLSAQLYQNILASETARGTALGDALSEFAAGLVDPDRTLGHDGKG